MNADIKPILETATGINPREIPGGDGRLTRLLGTLQLMVSHGATLEGVTTALGFATELPLASFQRTDPESLLAACTVIKALGDILGVHALEESSGWSVRVTSISKNRLDAAVRAVRQAAKTIGTNAPDIDAVPFVVEPLSRISAERLSSELNWMDCAASADLRS